VKEFLLMVDVSQTQVWILGYVVLAAFLGAVIGIDREMADKPAGLRTHMLVCSAATLLVALSDIVIEHFTGDVGNNVIRADPIRIIEAVITGVSFLGAGTILHRDNKNKVEGLTTAASLLVVAAIGVCVALSQIVLAIGVTVIVLVALRGVKFLEGWLYEA
jgi:putative Mg2+ transporter-C (MgtC) family protein